MTEEVLYLAPAGNARVVRADCYGNRRSRRYFRSHRGVRHEYFTDVGFVVEVLCSNGQWRARHWANENTEQSFSEEMARIMDQPGQTWFDLRAPKFVD